MVDFAKLRKEAAAKIAAERVKNFDKPAPLYREKTELEFVEDLIELRDDGILEKGEWIAYSGFLDSVHRWLKSGANARLSVKQRRIIEESVIKYSVALVVETETPEQKKAWEEKAAQDPKFDIEDDDIPF